MSTKAPKCSICGQCHRLGDPHIWNTGKEKQNKVATLKAKVATIRSKSVKNVATSALNVATLRQVSIRELNTGISAHLSDLPFEITKRDKVIARVTKP